MKFFEQSEAASSIHSSLHIRASFRVLKGYRFGRGKILQSKFQKMAKLHKNAKNVSYKNQAALQIWTGCQGNGDPAKGMKTMGIMPKAWGPWGSCQRHRDHVKDMGTMPNA